MATTSPGTDTEVDLYQVGASIMHKPSGLGIYGLYQHEESGGANGAFLDNVGNRFALINNPDTDVWYIKPFWRKAWSPIGATVLYGEYTENHDQFGAAEIDLCNVGFAATTTTGNFCLTALGTGQQVDALVTGSELQRWGLGVVQEIDSAAMHLWLRWQHQEFESLNVVGFDNVVGSPCENGCRFNQGFDDWDLIQAGGIIFF